MSETLPAEIEVTTSPDGVTTYAFPARELGKWRWLAVLPLGFGVGVMVFTTVWTIGFVGGLSSIFGPWGGLAGLFALPFFGGGLSILAIGFAIWLGRARLVVNDRSLIAIEQVGWFPYRRRIKRSDVARLQVHAGVSTRTNGQSQPVPVLTEYAVLSAELHSGKSKVLVPGYRRDLLLAFANTLATQLAVDSSSAEPSSAAIPVDVIDATDANREIERFEPPSGTRIEHQSLDDGCIFTVPAPGVWKGSKGLFGFSLLWCGFMVVFTTGVGAAFLGGDGPKDEARWIFPLFIVGFWAVGIGMMVAAINMGRRQAAIAVTNGGLKTIVSSMFGTTRKEWPLTELQTVRKGPSGMEVNDVPVMQLQIVPRDGAHYGLLSGLDEPELEWIATHLRRFMSVEPGTFTDDEADESDDASAGTR